MDPISQCHPAVSFLFFIGVIGCGMFLQHPAYLVPSILGGLGYYLLTGGQKKPLVYLSTMSVILAVVNPLFNTQGTHILFWIIGNPYTLEALIYGCALAGGLMGMFLWFSCCTRVLSGDKLISLLGNQLPALSLVLVMVLRMVPRLTQQTRQLLDTRRSIGKGAAPSAPLSTRLTEGMTALGCVVSWALEGSLVTADSMRARGYGAAKRQHFQIYQMDSRDWMVMGTQILMLSLTLSSLFLGQGAADYTPGISLAPYSWGAAIYGIYSFLPLVLTLKERLLWHISKSRI